MNIRTAAVFGASGEFGRHVLGVLESRGIAIRAMVHKTPIKNVRAEFIHGSVTDPKAVNNTIHGADAVLQLATTKEDRETFFDVSLRGTFNILESCREHRVHQVIFFSGDSTMGIWHYPQPIPIDEHHPHTAYPGYYAFSKVMEETMAEQYMVQYKVPISILRSSWGFESDKLLNHFSILKNVNPAEKGHGFGDITPEIFDLVKRGEERIPILTGSDGIPLHRHIVHIDDVKQAFDKMLGHPFAIGQSFNIAGPAPFNYRVAAEYISQRTDIPTIEIKCPYYHSFEINITKARTMLGYKPENDFFRMADRAIEERMSR
jgi:nucleoside-diphosphate-sugar epimerase